MLFQSTEVCQGSAILNYPDMYILYLVNTCSDTVMYVYAFTYVAMSIMWFIADYLTVLSQSLHLYLYSVRTNVMYSYVLFSVTTQILGWQLTPFIVIRCCCKSFNELHKRAQVLIIKTVYSFFGYNYRSLK